MVDPRKHITAGFLAIAITGAFWSHYSNADQSRPVEFNRDIRAILSDKCFACHGPDAETVEGDLRLDLPEQAKGDSLAIVAGDPEASELVRRIFASDEDVVMPPPDSHKSLAPAERHLLKRWIAEGAPYEKHWAYRPMRGSERDNVKPSTRVASDLNSTGWIDRQINERLEAEGVIPTVQTDRITLIRRLSFDLTGIPPTLDEVESFVKDPSTDAYERLVTRLLDSPRFGERMASYWLDLVRYADTVGYHGDQNVSQFAYRDYVINAFNDSMPYDQFIREQLAGDLLPNATIDQQVASGYNRLNQTTEEGGAQAKEYLAIYFADRVRNVSQVFMGATLGCAQCHDHKCDPYTTKDFYSFGAFFADLQEVGKYSGRSRDPFIRLYNDALKRKISNVDSELAKLDIAEKRLVEELLADQPEGYPEQGKLPEVVESLWVDDQKVDGRKHSGDWAFVTSPEDPVHGGKKSRRQQGEELVQHYFTGAKEIVQPSSDTRLFAWVYLDEENPPSAIMLQFNDGSSWEHRAVWGSDDIVYGRRDKSWDGYRRLGELPPLGQRVRLEVDPAQVGWPNPEPNDKQKGNQNKSAKTRKPISGMAFTQFGGTAYWDEAGWNDTFRIPDEVLAAAKVPRDKRSEAQTAIINDYYLANAEPLVNLKKRIAGTQSERTRLVDSAPTTVVSKSVKPRIIRILPRGNWMDDSGETVGPAIPEFLGKLDTGGGRATRFDLANWLCQSDHPLTARTMVNRLWSLMFGRGVCASVDDFGGQGTYPSHPELLDALAIEFIESGWDVKELLRTIAMSEAYQRSSTPTPQLQQADPYNELFARQGRFRVDAETVRDMALATSGLLVERIGGASARPYQPAGYYAQLNFPKRTYQADSDDNQYRRGVYTHWQRTFLHPMLKAFDAPSREECTAKRARSNTPLQALTLLNDPTFVEAARVFAAGIMMEGGPTTEDRIQWAYRTVVSHRPNKAIMSELVRLHDCEIKSYRDREDDAQKLIAIGASPVAEELNPVELAAWTSVARTLLNLHESIMRY